MMTKSPEHQFLQTETGTCCKGNDFKHYVHNDISYYIKIMQTIFQACIFSSNCNTLF